LPALPTLRSLILVGGGHAHLHVLDGFARRPVPGLRITLISRDVQTPYSGMLPGCIAGHYTRAQCHIDLRPLARRAGARLVLDEAIGIDRTAQRVICRRSAPEAYDIVSLDIGSTPHLELVPGAAAYATPVKPIDGLVERWEAIVARVHGGTGPMRMLTVGGGAAGVELTLAMQHRLHALRDPRDLTFTLVSDGEILAGHNASVRRRFRQLLLARGVQLVENDAVTRVQEQAVLCASGARLAYDELIWVTQAGAASWLAETGLALDTGGFIAIDATLRSVNDTHVFAAGDVASSVVHPRPKAGVFAVRQGPPLAANLRRALAGQGLLPFEPQRKFLSLISTGDKGAVASWGAWAAQGALLWHLKDRIDRRWMRQYQTLA
jgi:selenide,water dikinase